MLPCDKCLENNWKFENKRDINKENKTCLKWVLATCKICSYEVEFAFKETKLEYNDDNIDSDIIEVFTDGATIGHNGKLGTVKDICIGVHIPKLDINISKKMSGISNNEAEFQALIAAMAMCIDKGVKKAIFMMDSSIVVNRANGRRPKKLKHKNERMDAFQDIVLDLSSNFDYISFKWIPREENSIADNLSKQF